MSDSVQPHRQQPTRLPHPWDSPGKNTGVGCHFLFQCMKMKSQNEVAQSCPTLSNPMDCSLLGSSIHGIFQARVLEWGATAFSMNDYYWSINPSVETDVSPGQPHLEQFIEGAGEPNPALPVFVNKAALNASCPFIYIQSGAAFQL